MRVDLCNGFLNALALVNDGPNHATTYTLEPLPPARSLESSLEAHFSAMSTSLVPRQPAETWQIRATAFDDDWIQALREILHRWFFEQEFSPKVHPTIAENVVEEFLAQLRTTVGDARPFQVEVSPPMWYECLWRDVAFESQNGRWLLHLGFSD
jgi:hypothetical protein